MYAHDSEERICLKLGEYNLKFETSGLEPEHKDKAKEELRETEEVVEESLKTFRNLLKNEPNLIFPVDDDEKLKIFLRPTKFYPHSALILMKQFYKFKITHPQYYENLLPSYERRAFMQSLITVLPERNSNGERVLVVEAGKKWNTRTCSLNEIFRSVMLILEAAMSEPKTQVCGVQVILDMNGLSMQHVWQFTPSFAKHLTEWVQECIPIRLKGVHIVRQAYIFNMIYAIFKPFLGEKLQKRIHFHGTNMGSLHSRVSPSILPLHYGGQADIPFDKGEEFLSYLVNFESEYIERAQLGYSSRKDCD